MNDLTPSEHGSSPALRAQELWTKVADDFPEINPSNYDHDDVCALNNWGMEAVDAIRSLHKATQDIRDFLKAADAGWLGEMPAGFNRSAFVIALRVAASQELDQPRGLSAAEPSSNGEGVIPNPESR